MALRFVILHHRIEGGEHWDLCLERGEVLLTWRLEREPVDAASLPIAAQSLGDHRKAYLDYEGPLSRDRGDVRRVDGGRLRFEQVTAGRYVVHLDGARLSGLFTLTGEGDAWLFDALRSSP